MELLKTELEMSLIFRNSPNIIVCRSINTSQPAQISTAELHSASLPSVNAPLTRTQKMQLAIRL